MYRALAHLYCGIFAINRGSVFSLYGEQFYLVGNNSTTLVGFTYYYIRVAEKLHRHCGIALLQRLANGCRTNLFALEAILRNLHNFECIVLC